MFFLLKPPWALPGPAALATLATVIAGQAVIAGAFSMTRQAIRLGLLPRSEVRHTSATETGQIFLPLVNVLLLAGALVLVTGFRSSSALAAAYGIAVSGTMIVTTLLAYRLLRGVWRRHPAHAGAVIPPILSIEGAFLSVNVIEVPDGGRRCPSPTSFRAPRRDPHCTSRASRCSSPAMTRRPRLRSCTTSSTTACFTSASSS